MAATPLPCCDCTTWEWGRLGLARNSERSPRVEAHARISQPGSRRAQRALKHSFPNKSSPAWRSPGTGHFPFHDPPLLQVAARERGSSLARSGSPRGRAASTGAGMRAGSAAPRRAAPCSAREPRARAPRTPRPARLVLPRPPAARGGGGARPAPRSSADASGERARGVPSAPRKGGGGRDSCEGRRPAGRARARLGRPHPHRGALRRGERGGHELGRRVSGRASERARGPPPGLSPPARSPACAAPGAPGPHAQPRPTPDPARTALRRHILQLAAARARRERASSQPPRRARRRLPPRPRARPGPFSTRPALTCSQAQL